MAVLISANSQSKRIAPKDPEKGFQLDELYELLDCTTIEYVPVGPYGIVIDEEGKLKENWQDRINIVATMAFHRELTPGDALVGPVLVLARPGEFQ